MNENIAFHSQTKRLIEIPTINESPSDLFDHIPYLLDDDNCYTIRFPLNVLTDGLADGKTLHALDQQVAHSLNGFTRRI